MKGTKSSLFQRLDLIQKMNGGIIPDNAFVEIFGSRKSNILDFKWDKQKRYFPDNMCESCLNNYNGNCIRYCKKFYRKTMFLGGNQAFTQVVWICKNYVNSKKFCEKIKNDKTLDNE